MSSPDSRKLRKDRERQALSFPVARPDATEETTGHTVTVADGVLQARIPMPMDLEHINVYLLRDDDGWWLVDTGLDTQSSQRCWQTVAANSEALEGLPFKGLICTHFHHDHTGMAGWLTTQFDIPLYMSHSEYLMLRLFSGNTQGGIPDEQLAFYQRSGLPQQQIDSLVEALERNHMPLACPGSYHRLRDGDTFTIGNRKWQVVVGEGHTPEHVCLYAAEERLLVAGDQVLPDISPNIMVGHLEPDADPMSGWFASLDRLDQLAADTLVMPSHGDVFRNLHQRVQQLRDHHDRQFDSLRSLAETATSFTAFEAMQWLFPYAQKGVQIILALGETIAHLTWLTRHADFSRDLNDSVYVYSRDSQVDVGVRSVDSAP